MELLPTLDAQAPPPACRRRPRAANSMNPGSLPISPPPWRLPPASWRRPFVVHGHDLDGGLLQDSCQLARMLHRDRGFGVFGMLPIRLLEARLMSSVIRHLSRATMAEVAVRDELVVRVVHVGDAAGHARGEVAPGGSEDDERPSVMYSQPWSPTPSTTALRRSCGRRSVPPPRRGRRPARRWRRRARRCRRGCSPRPTRRCAPLRGRR